MRADRFVHSSCPPECRAEIVVRLGKVRLEIDRAAVRRDRLLELPLSAMHIPEVVVENRDSRRDPDGLANQIRSDVRPGLLQRDEAQKVQGIAMPWLRRQDLAADSVRLRETPRMLVLQCKLESLLDGDFWHRAASLPERERRCNEGCNGVMP